MVSYRETVHKTRVCRTVNTWDCQLPVHKSDSPVHKTHACRTVNTSDCQSPVHKSDSPVHKTHACRTVPGEQCTQWCLRSCSSLSMQLCQTPSCSLRGRQTPSRQCHTHYNKVHITHHLHAVTYYIPLIGNIEQRQILMMLRWCSFAHYKPFHMDFVTQQWTRYQLV